MEFVKDQNGSTTQAKIAWFLRPRDILGKKKNFDSRLLRNIYIYIFFYILFIYITYLLLAIYYTILSMNIRNFRNL